MFTFFKRKSTPPPVPASAPKLPSLPISGFPLHTPEAFQGYFDFLTPEQAEKAAEIYWGLITPGSNHQLSLQILKEPHNAFAISNLVFEHVGIENKNKRGGVATFLSFIAGEVYNIERRMDAAIIQEKWMYAHCDCPNHEKFDGKKYHIMKGLLHKGTYIRPHGEFGCKCVASAVVEF